MSRKDIRLGMEVAVNIPGVSEILYGRVIGLLAGDVVKVELTRQGTVATAEVPEGWVAPWNYEDRPKRKR